MESIQVSIRIRPFLQNEKIEQSPIDITESNGNKITIVKGKKTIETIFDKIFYQNSTQNDIFEFIKPIITSTLNGINSTILVYGQTGSGKTYTMFGEDWTFNNNLDIKNNNINNNNYRNILSDQFNFLIEPDFIVDPFSESNGIIPRIIIELFKFLESSNDNIKISVSYIQVYNEKIYDLLIDNYSLDNIKDKKDFNISFKDTYEKIFEQPPLKLREDKKNGVIIQGAKEIFVNTFYDVFQVLKNGELNRKKRETNQNYLSSRSHTIFIVYFSNFSNKLSSKISFCDLAGSEKYDIREHYEYNHLNELKSINKSLSVLGNVIHALSKKNNEGKKKLNQTERKNNNLKSKPQNKLSKSKNNSQNNIFMKNNKSNNRQNIPKLTINNNNNNNNSLSLSTRENTNKQKMLKSSKSNPNYEKTNLNPGNQEIKFFKIHVPYKDSQLTYLLKDSLGGNSKTYIIANISPNESNFEESYNTILFAARAKKIETKIIPNKLIDDNFQFSNKNENNINIFNNDKKTYNNNNLNNNNNDIIDNNNEEKMKKLNNEINELRSLLEVRTKRGTLNSIQEEFIKLKEENFELRNYVENIGNNNISRIIRENQKLKKEIKDLKSNPYDKKENKKKNYYQINTNPLNNLDNFTLPKHLKLNMNNKKILSNTGKNIINSNSNIRPNSVIKKNAPYFSYINNSSQNNFSTGNIHKTHNTIKYNNAKTEVLDSELSKITKMRLKKLDELYNPNNPKYKENNQNLSHNRYISGNLSNFNHNDEFDIISYGY